VRIGELTERVVIQTSTTSPDAYGGRSDSWGTLATVWANVRPLSGQEALVAAGVKPEALTRYEVTIRYRSDVTPLMRLSWGSRTLWIESVTEAGRQMQEWTVLQCADRV